MKKTSESNLFSFFIYAQISVLLFFFTTWMNQLFSCLRYFKLHFKNRQRKWMSSKDLQQSLQSFICNIRIISKSSGKWIFSFIVMKNEKKNYRLAEYLMFFFLFFFSKSKPILDISTIILLDLQFHMKSPPPIIPEIAANESGRSICWMICSNISLIIEFIAVLLSGALAHEEDAVRQKRMGPYPILSLSRNSLKQSVARLPGESNVLVAQTM